MYHFIRKVLFWLPPEFSHRLALSLLPWIYPVARVKKIQSELPKKPVTLWGLNFPNPVGLAAGLDKNADHVDALFGLGFGFIEVGAVTPQAQSGNPKPRLYRLTKRGALINQMGFNNFGVDYLINQLKKRRIPGIVGVNLGKNKYTSLEVAHQDYETCLEKIYPYADYVSINISSPNTEGLRELQDEKYLFNLLTRLINLRDKLADKYQKHMPLLVKISPDLSLQEINQMADTFLKTKIEGVIAVNTTRDRSQVTGVGGSDKPGGLSGKPLLTKMLTVLTHFKTQTEGKIPLIAVGGIDSIESAKKAFQAGATLIQIYTGLVYQGPKLIKKIISDL